MTSLSSGSSGADMIASTRPMRHWLPRSFRLQRVIRRAISIGSLALVASCGGLLTVTDPTIVQDSDIANAGGANARRLSVMFAVNNSISEVFGDVALFTDEQMYDTYSPQWPNVYEYIDMRDSAHYQSSYGVYDDPMVGPMTSVLISASVALPSVQAYTPDSVRNEYLGQIYALRGFAIVQLAEDVCSGFPINDIRDGKPYYSMPYTPAVAFQYAVATLDTALAFARDSARFVNLARVLKGRALLGAGQWDLAAQAVAGVPTDFVYQTDQGYSVSFDGWTFPDTPHAVGNRDGGVGLPFVSANDPRVPTQFVQMRSRTTSDPVSDSLHQQLKYATSQSPVTLASGVEATLTPTAGWR